MKVHQKHVRPRSTLFFDTTTGYQSREMKDRSWGCSVSRTCLKNTATDPVVIHERSSNPKQAISKGPVRQVEAMPSFTIDMPVTNKEGVDALNTLILRKLAKESFMGDSVAKKVGCSEEPNCEEKAGVRENLREARSTIISCKCGMHAGKELSSSFFDLQKNTMCMDRKTNLASFSSGNIPEGVGSLLSRIGLDHRKKFDQELPVFQNSSAFDKSPQHRTSVLTQNTPKSTFLQDAGEEQSFAANTVPRELLSISTEQASKSRSSMHPGRYMCIPEASSLENLMRPDFSPFRRCSAVNHGESAAFNSKFICPSSTHDELDTFERYLPRPHVNSPVHTEAPQGLTKPSSHHNALTEGMQFRMDEIGDFRNLRSKPRAESTFTWKDPARKIYRDEGEVAVASLNTSSLEQLKTSEHVHWNLGELMQRQEVEDDVDDNLDVLRNTYVFKRGSDEIGCQLEELPRRLIRNRCDAKQEELRIGRGTPRRHELDPVKLKHGERQLDGLIQEAKKAESNAKSKSKFLEDRSFRPLQIQKQTTERKFSQQRSRVRSSCTSENCRNVEANEEDGKVFQGIASRLDTRKVVTSQKSLDDSAVIQELEGDWGTGRDDLEVLLKFLTMKQQLRENRQSDVDVVVQTEATVRELLCRMKLNSCCSSSTDSDSSFRFVPRSNACEPVVDGSYGVKGKICKWQGRSSSSTTGTINAIVHDMDAGLAPEINADSHVVSLQKQSMDCQSRSEICWPPIQMPSSSESQPLQCMKGSASVRNTTSCDRDFYNVQSEEHDETVNPSPPAKRHMIDLSSEDVVRVGRHRAVDTGESSSTTRVILDKMDIGSEMLGSTECKGIKLSTEASCSSVSSQMKAADDQSRTADAIQLRAGRNSESRSVSGSAPAIPWNYQREMKSPIGRSVQPASPSRRSALKSPTYSPQHHRQCCESSATKPSPNNRYSSLSLPQGQQRQRPATAKIHSSAAQHGAQTSTKIPSKELSSQASQDVSMFPAGISDSVVQESIALAKDSSDPYADFRDSMLEMMHEKNLWQRQDELQDLLQCFLHLNQPMHHQLIHQVFSDVVCNGSHLNNHAQSSKSKRSKVISNHKSSPSRPRPESPHRKSPGRGGG